MDKMFFEFLNTKEVRCIYCGNVVNLETFGYNTCDSCESENKFSKFYVKFKNGYSYNLSDYCIEHGLYEVDNVKKMKKFIKIMDYEIADR